MSENNSERWNLQESIVYVISVIGGIFLNIELLPYYFIDTDGMFVFFELAIGLFRVFLCIMVFVFPLDYILKIINKQKTGLKNPTMINIYFKFIGVSSLGFRRVITLIAVFLLLWSCIGILAFIFDGDDDAFLVFLLFPAFTLFIKTLTWIIDGFKKDIGK